MLCKCFERIIVNSLQSYLEENTLLSAHQFGFRAGHSVEDQLLLTYNDITSWLDEGYMVDLILFDFSKAFDLVNHDILLTKLSRIGIGGSVLLWIREFLRGKWWSVVKQVP